MPSPLRRHPAEDDSPARASFVELFFDLVFVLAVTQLSSVLIDDLTVPGAAETLFLLLTAWWAWIYTTWMTNWFDGETRPVRAILLVGMLASLCGAIAIPEAFGDRAGLFVVGYVGIQLVRNAFMVLATQRGDPLHTPLVRIFVWSAWSASSGLPVRWWRATRASPSAHRRRHHRRRRGRGAGDRPSR